jgi:adenylosuccinate synthase
MMKEISLEQIAERSEIPIEDLRQIEVGTVSGKPRRIGEFDWEQARRSASLNGVTDIALTFADYLGIANRKAHSFEELSPGTRAFIEEVERVTNARVSLISKDFGKDAVIIDRRDWGQGRA